LLIAGAAWLGCASASADDDRHAERSSGGRSTQGGANGPRAGNDQGSPRAGAAPATGGRASEQHTYEGRNDSYRDPSLSSPGSAGAANEFSGTPWNGPSSDPGGFSDLSAALENPGYATYLGAGAGKGTAFFPSSSFSKFAWQLFLGVRVKYVGAEIGYSHLSTIPATINSQQVDLSTETLSLSLLGYLPLTPNTDLYLRYGGMNWMVSANSSTTGYAPVTNGFNRLWGAGVEFRRGALFLGLERDIFRHVYQSNYYSFVGLRLGAYIY